jgi:hypothetical protein
MKKFLTQQVKSQYGGMAVNMLMAKKQNAFSKMNTFWKCYLDE